MGVVLKKLNRSKEAEKFYKKSIKMNKSYPSSYLNLAVMYKEQNNFDTAIYYLSEGIKNNPSVAYLYYNRGCTFAKMKKYDLAKNDINKSIELDSFFIEYSKKDSELTWLYT